MKIIKITIAILFYFICSLEAEQISFKAYDINNQLFFEQQTTTENDTVIKFTLNRTYQKGDYFSITGSKFLNIQLDSSIQASEIYAPDAKFKFTVPVGENKINYPEHSFTGSEHKIVVRGSSRKEKSTYRNVALNGFDIRGISNFYPHATSNSECRGESYYAARNAIDGYKTNTLHGKWPYQSWGPDKGDSLWLKIDFGRKVEIDKFVIVNRAQYADSHDSYWNMATIEFSDGKTEKIKIEKTHLPQEIKIKKHKTSWVKLTSLKAYEPKWCSWIEFEAWGK